MDERLARLNLDVARAADAWLQDPTDPNVYGRLVRAVLIRRAYLQPGLPEDPPEPVVTPPTQPDEILDELAGERPPAQVGQIMRDTPEDWRPAAP